MGKIKILIADDHPFIRVGIRNLIAKIPNTVVVGEAANGIETLQLVQEREPDLLLLDLQMPYMDGVQVAKALKAMGSKTLIFVICANNEPELIKGVLNLGISRFISKEDAPVKLAGAIMELAQMENG